MTLTLDDLNDRGCSMLAATLCAHARTLPARPLGEFVAEFFSDLGTDVLGRRPAMASYLETGTLARLVAEKKEAA